jgi:hypothetical protein
VVGLGFDRPRPRPPVLAPRHLLPPPPANLHLRACARASALRVSESVRRGAVEEEEEEREATARPSRGRGGRDQCFRCNWPFKNSRVFCIDFFKFSISFFLVLFLACILDCLVSFAVRENYFLALHLFHMQKYFLALVFSLAILYFTRKNSRRRNQ